MTAPLSVEVKLGRENERLRKENSHLRALNKKVLQSGDNYDKFIDELRELHKGETKVFAYTTKRETPATAVFDKSVSEIACVNLSDLHLTEDVRPQDNNGINIYNSMVAANRLWGHCQKAKLKIKQHSSLNKIESIWSMILGDMINGTIHPEMIITNDLTDTAAVVLCARLLLIFYKELASLGLPIDIDTICGNHPRLTAKMPTKRMAHTNLDWLIYEYLSDLVKGDDQINMNIHTGQIGQKKIKGWNYVFEHGIDVKSGGEESFEDRLRALFDDPVFRKATGFTGPAFDQIVIGNMHKEKFLERTVVNGAYVGQNELGMSWRLKPIKASQLMWGIGKDQPRTWQYSIDLTDITSAKVQNPMSEYTSWFLKKHGK